MNAPQDRSEPLSAPTYYVEGPDRFGIFELRQTRYRGQDHPHDVCAVGNLDRLRGMDAMLPGAAVAVGVYEAAAVRGDGGAHVLRLDGEAKGRYSTHNKALEDLHRLQGQSWSYAFEHGGWSLKEEDGPTAAVFEVGQTHQGTEWGVFDAPTVLDPADEYLPLAEVLAFIQKISAERGCNWRRFDCTYAAYRASDANETENTP